MRSGLQLPGMLFATILLVIALAMVADHFWWAAPVIHEEGRLIQ